MTYKYTVTREQQDAVNRLKNVHKATVEYVILCAYTQTFVTEAKSLNGLDPRKIIAIWDEEVSVDQSELSYSEVLSVLGRFKSVKVTNPNGSEIIINPKEHVPGYLLDTKEISEKGYRFHLVEESNDV